MINLNIRYLQGVRHIEDSLQQRFAKHRNSLCKNAFYSSKEKAFAFTVTEPWTQNTEAGLLKLNTYIHLYRLVGHEDATAQLISENADEIIRLKEALQKPSLTLRPENFCLLHRLNFYANDCSGYF